MATGAALRLRLALALLSLAGNTCCNTERRAESWLITDDNDKMSQRCRQVLLLLWCCNAVSAVFCCLCCCRRHAIACCRHGSRSSAARASSISPCSVGRCASRFPLLLIMRRRRHDGDAGVGRLGRAWAAGGLRSAQQHITARARQDTAACTHPILGPGTACMFLTHYEINLDQRILDP
eukprot:COSAG01_NODE_11462_length_1929_cov_1.735519_3_plen_178_part_01